MNDPHSNILRYREIRFKPPLSDGVTERGTLDKFEEMEMKLNALDGIDELHSGYNQISVRYRFPLLTFATILNTLDSINEPPQYSLPRRILYALTAFMEQNERDYLINPDGWHTYIEDIYVHYFNLRIEGKTDIRKQTWRKYKKGNRN
ncbi:MAG: hypothetical protein ACE5GZ_02295 [Gammaproteobacteria bacterium]